MSLLKLKAALYYWTGIYLADKDYKRYRDNLRLLQKGSGGSGGNISESLRKGLWETENGFTRPACHWRILWRLRLFGYKYPGLKWLSQFISGFLMMVHTILVNIKS